MLKITISTVGKTKENWLDAALEEYEKRLRPSMGLRWRLFSKEADLYKALLEEKDYIALHPKGAFLTSEEVSKKLFSEWGARSHFAIGGPDGFPSEIIQNARFCWSFSPLTFTHQIARLLLVEQLYRAVEIEKNSGYHR